MVLMKNDGNLLPLSFGQKIGIIGDFAFQPRFQGAGSSSVNAIRVEKVAECIGKTDFTLLGMEKGYLRNGKEDKKLENDALKLAERADVSLDTIKSVENGRRAMSLDTYLNIVHEKVIVEFKSGTSVDIYR